MLATTIENKIKTEYIYIKKKKGNFTYGYV